MAPTIDFAAKSAVWPGFCGKNLCLLGVTFGGSEAVGLAASWDQLPGAEKNAVRSLYAGACLLCCVVMGVPRTSIPR